MTHAVLFDLEAYLSVVRALPDDDIEARRKELHDTDEDVGDDATSDHASDGEAPPEDAVDEAEPQEEELVEEEEEEEHDADGREE
jgi:hypothetical protein